MFDSPPLVAAPPRRDHFAQRLAEDGQTLTRISVATLQLHLGKRCNLACHHCHVEAGPKRNERMSWETLRKVLDWVDTHRHEVGLEVVDLTGGAPEMHPHFRRLLRELKLRRLHVLDRCNLTILLEPGYEDLIELLARHEVEIVASLPCYLEENVDAQRGRGVFGRSIEALRRLNAAGFGMPGSHLRLDLVYNPVGDALPPDQAQLEADYQRQLESRFGIHFHRLFTITNMPIKRFATQLRRRGRHEQYLASLVSAHRPANVEHVMCRRLLSVGWQGGVYDCDFNQMLGMPLAPAAPGSAREGSEVDEEEIERRSAKLWQLAPDELIGRGIRTAAHCFGCTAGAGSSCTGAFAKSSPA